MNRRSFFRSTVGAVIAAACAPLLTNGIVAPDHFDLSGLTYGDGTVGDITRATYSFWRNQSIDGSRIGRLSRGLDEAMRAGYNRCE